ncbi:MAG: flavodoxin family protein [Lachnospiraceae bacterium]|nr:flavodoxin family protein [Lachnospiraceae bacterium]
MNIIVLNGSPRKEKSCTTRVTEKFLEGIQRVENCEIERIDLNEADIRPCLGCLSCWGRTEGECIIKNDDILSIKEKILKADVIIESYPLYFFGMPGVVKVFTDRMLSMMCTYKGQSPQPGNSFHGIRDHMEGKSFFIISTCGYAQTEYIYEPLLAQYDCICGPGHYYALLCPQGKCLSIPELFDRMEVYLEKYALAGEEFARTGTLSSETVMNLRVPPFNERRFKLLLNKFWADEKEQKNVL